MRFDGGGGGFDSGGRTGGELWCDRWCGLSVAFALLIDDPHETAFEGIRDGDVGRLVPR